MPKNHESKLFIVRTIYTSGKIKHQVNRTRKAARDLAETKRAQRNVRFSTVLPATWGPDA